jgi:UDP-N-acetylmuramoylalanine--D-glutamate ligase
MGVGALSQHATKSIAVIGLGKTGISCVRYCLEKGYKVIATDTRLQPPGLTEFIQNYPQVSLFLGELSSEKIAQADEIVVSPGVSLDYPAIVELKALGKSIIGDIDLFAREAKAPIIAITGSNGKTTVTTLLGEMFAQAGKRAIVCGNIGTPVLEVLEQPVPEFYVLELSSFQLETTHLMATQSAAVLNISPDHMDRYAGFLDYVAAKRKIYADCQRPVVNADEAAIWQGVVGDRLLSFSVNSCTADFCVLTKGGEKWLAFHEEALVEVDKLPLKGAHHWQNALAALALGYAAGLSMEAMLEAVQRFNGLRHRCQWVRQHNGVQWYNDSKATNVGAAQTAIESLCETVDGKIILIAGGVGKGADFSSLRHALDRCVGEVILLGEDRQVLATAIEGCAELSYADSLEAAVQQASIQAREGDLVLLSPACASFDMFANFEARGESFIQLVNQL